MGQRYIDFLETDIVLVQETLNSVRSPVARTVLAKLVNNLNGSMWLETPGLSAARPLALETPRAPSEHGETVDWF